MLLGALAVADADVQTTDPQVAAREQGTHLKLTRKRDRLFVVVRGVVVHRTSRGGLAEHVQRGRRIPALTSLLGEAQRPLGGGRCLLDTIAVEAGLTERCEDSRL